LINDSLQGALDLLPHVVGQKISIETTLAESAGSISADPSQIHQVLLDLVLLSNQRMPCGGKITIESDSVELLPEYARTHTRLRPGRYLVVSVSYAGAVMMPGHDDPEIDCPAVCETIRELGGDILIRSEPGRLTTHEIYLPRIVADAPTAHSNGTPGRTGTSGR
jgi:signal transduction histidine kinase